MCPCPFIFWLLLSAQEPGTPCNAKPSQLPRCIHFAAFPAVTPLAIPRASDPVHEAHMSAIKQVFSAQQPPRGLPSLVPLLLLHLQRAFSVELCWERQGLLLAGSSMLADLPAGARLLQYCTGKIAFRKLPVKSRTSVLHYSPRLIMYCFHDLPLTACIVTGVAVH